MQGPNDETEYKKKEQRDPLHQTGVNTYDPEG